MVNSIQALDALGADVIARIDSVISQFNDIKSIRENMNENTVDAEVEDLHEKFRDLSDLLSLLRSASNSYFANVKDAANYSIKTATNIADAYHRYFQLDMNQSIVTQPVQFKFYSFVPHDDNSKDLEPKDISTDEVTTVMIDKTIINNTILAAQYICQKVDYSECGDMENLLKDVRVLVNYNFNKFITESPNDVLNIFSEQFVKVEKLKSNINEIMNFMEALLSNIVSLNAQLNVLSKEKDYTL